jgi:hypothetical protein
VTCARREENAELESAVREIERYLRAHPNASDTLLGVRDWWLEGLDAVLPLTVVQLALDRLVADRVVAARPIPGAVVYGRIREGEHE